MNIPFGKARLATAVRLCGLPRCPRGTASMLGSSRAGGPCRSSCDLSGIACPIAQLGLQFPAGGNAQHTIDLALHPEAGLLSDAGAAGNKHPLIIRMETVTDRGLKEGHTLEVRCCYSRSRLLKAVLEPRRRFCSALWDHALCHEPVDETAAVLSMAGPHVGLT